jgi:hypothetical protein
MKNILLVGVLLWGAFFAGVLFGDFVEIPAVQWAILAVMTIVNHWAGLHYSWMMREYGWMQESARQRKKVA